MKKILVIDDEINIGLWFSEELEAEGYEVSLATSFRDARGKIEKEHPDLITLDVKMPEGNGIEFLREIKANYINIPVILCTAYPNYKQDFRGWAADAYVTKSTDLEELKTSIRELVHLDTVAP